MSQRLKPQGYQKRRETAASVAVFFWPVSRLYEMVLSVVFSGALCYRIVGKPIGKRGLANLGTVVMTVNESRLKRSRLLAALLSVCGIALSYIALEQHVIYVNGFEAGPSFCHINEHFNCEAVNASEWSSLFGLPVASYGMFFYSALLLASALARSHGFLPLRAWGSLTLGLSALASFLSLVLFGISELFIGALCLICIGLYLVNFLLFASAWRALRPIPLRECLREGCSTLFSYIKVALGLARGDGLKVRGTAVVVAMIAGVSILLPEILFERLLAKMENSVDAVTAWERSPLVSFSLDLSGGAFGDYYQGDLSAPLKIVEFADYECPACRGMYQILHDLLAKYPGRSLFVFKNYPLDKSCNPQMQRELHEYACTAALFSRCAGEQGKFWESMEILFSKDAEKGELTLQSLTEKGSEELSLDKEGIVECMQSQRYAKKVQKDIADGAAAGLMGTPSIWINGRYVAEPSARNIEKIFKVVLERAAK